MYNQPNTVQTPQGQHQPGAQTQTQPAPTNQVPDHRFDELQKQLRTLADQNQQLRGQIDYMAKNPNQPAPAAAPENSPFEEKVDAALNAKIQEALTAAIDPLKNQMSQQVGYLVDRTDELNYMQKYGGDERYTKLNDKVEQIRQDAQIKGSYLSREDALRMAYFEETGRKAKEAPIETQAPQQPVFDPHFGTMVDPITRMPISASNPEQAMQQQAMQQTQGQEEQVPGQVPAWQQPAQQQQAAPAPQQQMPSGYAQPTSQHPNTNPFAQAPQLPDQGVNSSFPGQQNQQQGHMNLDISASDAQLEAFAEKYGDVPL